MENKFLTFLSDSDVIAYSLLSIGLVDIHETLGLCALVVSISYSILKIKQDFFNKK